MLLSYHNYDKFDIIKHMDDKLIKALEMLKETMNNDPRIIALNKIEDELNKNEEVMLLSYKKDIECLHLEDALKAFKDDSEEVRQAQRKLYLAKLELDTHPLVKRYNKAYIEVRKMYEKINKTIFNDFSSHKCSEFDD